MRGETDGVIIQFRVDLQIRLINTATGLMIPERDVVFCRDEAELPVIQKDPGYFVAINVGRKAGRIKVSAAGYEEKVLAMKESDFSGNGPPELDFYLIPEKSYHGRVYDELAGTLEGIESIEAVEMTQFPCYAGEYDSRKKILSLINPHRTRMRHTYYGLVHMEQNTFESITVEKEVSQDAIKIAGGIEEEFLQNSPIGRVIFGQVFSDGRYVLRVEESGTSESYLIKYKVNGETRFQKADLLVQTGNFLE